MKKVFLFVLALLMLTGCAAQPEEDAAVAALKPSAAHMLRFIEPEKKQYGFPDVEFSGLSLGRRIPAYVLEPAGLRVHEDLLYYPIMDGSRWVATAVVTPHEEGDAVSSVFAQYSDRYNGENRTGDVALIFAAEGAYLLAGQELLLTAASHHGGADLAKMEGWVDPIQAEQVALTAVCPIFDE